MNAEPRDWGEDAKTPDYTELMSKHFQAQGSTAMLRPVQAASLVEMGRYGGLFGPQSVGSGVVLTSILSVIVSRANRPLMLVPATLQAKLRQDMQAWRKDWLIPHNVQIVSFEMLAHASHSKDLDMAKPDIIVVPYCLKLKSKDSKATQIVAEYMAQNPSTKFVAFSGNIDTFDEYLHVIQWCLKDKMPLRAEGESRKSYRARLLQTPGIVGDYLPIRSVITDSKTSVIDVLVSSGLASSPGQARTFIEQGAVEIENFKVVDKTQKLRPGTHIIKIGRHTKTKVTLS